MNLNEAYPANAKPLELLHDLVGDQRINERDQPVIDGIKKDFDGINVDFAADVEIVVPVHHRVADGTKIMIVLLRLKCHEDDQSAR